MNNINSNTQSTEEVNNHVHSHYSFSPYSPTEIITEAIKSGIQIIGLMDHDSVSGANEFLKAGKKYQISTTIGCEIRANLTNTNLYNKQPNNPDEPNIIYMALHGIPADKLVDVDRYLQPIRAARKKRTKKEVDKLNQVLKDKNINQELSFENDILPISKFNHGGTVTERHILFALSNKFILQYPKKDMLLDYIETYFNFSIREDLKQVLLDNNNPYYAYDLLGLLKSSLVPEFFIPSTNEECPCVHEIVDFAKSIGSIPAYAYLGDINDSPTGDKKAQEYEDSYLDELLDELSKIGFQAITYMPPRNTKNQIMRLQKLCKERGLMEISGVDINSPRQSFRCPVILEPEFKHLITSAWALVAHEKLSENDASYGLFYQKSNFYVKNLYDRIQSYAVIGKRLQKEDIDCLRETI